MNLKKKSFTLNGHKTSVALEPEFWEGLKVIAGEQSCTLSGLVSQIDEVRKDTPLASSLRVTVLNHYRKL